MMNNKQQYLDIAEGKGEKAPSTMVAFSSREMNYPLLESLLEAQSFFTDGEVSYTEQGQGGFFYTCRHHDRELTFYLEVSERDPENSITPIHSTDPISPELLAQANAATQEVMVECIFGPNPLEDYVHQLRLLSAVVPDFLLGIDISAAGNVFTREWLNFQLEDDVLPEIESLYTIHAVYDTENDPPTTFWFHSHGLARCGLTEAELVIPETLSSYYGIPDLFRSFVNNAIQNQQITFNEPILCGQTDSGYEYLVALPFEEGLRHVNQSTPIDQLRPLEDMRYDLEGTPEGVFLGDRADRDDVHQEPSCMLFRTNEENPVLQTFFKGFDEQNAIMFWRTNAETAEMSRKAQLRWRYFVNMFKNYHVSDEPAKPGFLAKLLKKAPKPVESEWRFMVKFGIPHGEEGEEREHMWFIPEKIHDTVVTGTLINHPFYVEDMQEGGVYSVDISRVTDWAIYYQGDSYKPDTIYKLLSHSQTH